MTYVEDAVTLLDNPVGARASRRKRRKTQFFDDRDEDSGEADGDDRLRSGVFFAVIDRLAVGLEERKGAYKNVFTVFRVLFDLQDLTAETIAVEAIKLHETHPEDISKDVIEELLHSRGFAHIEEDKSLDTTNLCKWIRDNDLAEVFPNVEIAARIYQSMAVSNCSSERSFSCLKRIKTYPRSSMEEPRLNDLAILGIEPEMVESISFDDVIEDFCDRKARREISFK